MVGFLLDTHALAWALFDEQRLSDASRTILQEEADVLFSPISLFEMETKSAVGKWPWNLPGDWQPALRSLAVKEVAVEWRHAVEAGRLPLHHRDPWDRLLIAQARIHDLTVVTADRAFGAY